MAHRTSDSRDIIVTQSARLCLLGSYTYGAGAAVILPIPAFSAEYGRDTSPGGIAIPMYLAATQSLYLQPTTDANIRFVERGTTAASGTITFAAASGTITITLHGRSVSFTATGVNATDAALAATTINADSYLAAMFLASAVAAVCTVTMRVPGIGGNKVTFAGSGTGATFSGAGFLASGVGPTAGATALNAVLIKAGLLYPSYKFIADEQIDIIAVAAGSLLIFAGA